jgi:hypothetical protein
MRPSTSCRMLSLLLATSSADLKEGDIPKHNPDTEIEFTKKRTSTKNSNLPLPHPALAAPRPRTKKNLAASVVITASPEIRESGKFPRNSVVARLASAARYHHAAAVAAASEQQRQNATTRSLGSTTAVVTKPRSSLRGLTKAIDQELLMTRNPTIRTRRTLTTGAFGGIAAPAQLKILPLGASLGLARDSMTALAQHNQRFENQHQARSTNYQRHVAIVLAKPLIDNRVSVEYFMRMQNLCQALADADSQYQPSLIVFIGSGIGRSRTAVTQNTTVDGRLTDVDAGYQWFLEECSRQDIRLDGTSFHLERKSVEKGGLRRVADVILRKHIPEWYSAFTTAAELESCSGSSGGASTSSWRPSKKLSVHVSLFSSEYHLCQLHDIHTRSPGNSYLRPFNDNFGDSRVVCTWTYRYSSTIGVPYDRVQLSSKVGESRNDSTSEKNLSAEDRLQSRVTEAQSTVRTIQTQFFRAIQSLVPVLINLRGIIANDEFFQRDNFLVLQATRRILVSQMELLYKNPLLLEEVHHTRIFAKREKSSSNTTEAKEPNAAEATAEGDRAAVDGVVPISGGIVRRQSSNYTHLDVLLETALLSMGRCLDLVRPAGLLSGVVTPSDWKLARYLLEQTIIQISRTCDPDLPLENC